MLRTVSMKELNREVDVAMEKGEEFTLVITGWSMAPSLYPHRDKAVIRPLDRPVKKGDIILFRRNDSNIVIHRAIAVDKTNGRITMNGDAQSWTEEIEPKQVLGRAFYLIRKGKSIYTDSISYKVYTFFWGLTRPFRKTMVSIRRKLLTQSEKSHTSKR